MVCVRLSALSQHDLMKVHTCCMSGVEHGSSTMGVCHVGCTICVGCAVACPCTSTQYLWGPQAVAGSQPGRPLRIADPQPGKPLPTGALQCARDP
jgi:hypothetical protein